MHDETEKNRSSGGIKCFKCGSYLGINFPLSLKPEKLDEESMRLWDSSRIMVEAWAVRFSGNPTPVGMIYDESSSSLDFCQFVSYYLWTVQFTFHISTLKYDPPEPTATQSWTSRLFLLMSKLYFNLNSFTSIYLIWHPFKGTQRIKIRHHSCLFLQTH